MTGNLHPSYMLRVARLERARERFRRGAIHENEFRELLAADGMLERSSQDAEIRDCLPGMHQIGDALDPVSSPLEPK